MTQNQTFAAHCPSCFGLCCTALSFQRGNQFGHDKPAGQPCHYLAPDFRCSIHARREDLGYDGCEAFDCIGAGQRASQIFQSQKWKTNPQIAQKLFATFSILLRVQEMRQALETAETLDIAQDLHDERMTLLERLAALADGGRQDIGGEASLAIANAKAFLKRLAPLVAL